MKTKANERGYTMLEAIIYIGLLIALGGWLASLAHNVHYRYKVGRVTQQVLELKKAISHFTATSETYTNLSIQNMNSGSALPLDMRTSNNTKAKHALGGEILLGCAQTLVPGNIDDYKYLFYITFKNLSQKACVEVLTQGQFYGDGSELDALIVNSNKGWKYRYSIYSSNAVTFTTISIGNSFSATNNIHLSVAQALNACSRKYDNTITWIFS